MTILPVSRTARSKARDFATQRQNIATPTGNLALAAYSTTYDLLDIALVLWNTTRPIG
jgi:hypothetical protein